MHCGEHPVGLGELIDRFGRQMIGRRPVCRFAVHLSQQRAVARPMNWSGFGPGLILAGSRLPRMSQLKNSRPVPERASLVGEPADCYGS
jgi:hypothetical protein